MFNGILPALVTPFRDDSEQSIDWDAWESLIEWQIAAGVHGLVIYGTTGESATLTTEEKLQLTNRTQEIVRKRVPIIAGTGSNCTRSTIEFTLEVKKTGVDAALLVAPYYNRPTQAGLYAHFKAVAEAAKLPLVLYNVPGRTAVEISVDTIDKLADVPGIVAIKQATDSVSNITELCHRVKSRIAVLAGDDPLTWLVLALGGTGVISASASAVPEKFVELYRLFTEGKIEASRDLQAQILPLIRAMFMETNPAPAKAALLIREKLSSDALRLPLVRVSPETRAQMTSALKSAGIA